MYERKKLGVLQPNLVQKKLSFEDEKSTLSSRASRKRKMDENGSHVKNSRKDGIYEDPVTQLPKRSKLLSSCNVEVQTEPDGTVCKQCSGNEKKERSNTDVTNNEPSSLKSELCDEATRKNIYAQEIVDMITNEPGEKYYELLAKERKRALIAALEENKQLHEQNAQLQRRVHHLEAEIEQLEGLLKEAKILAQLVQEATAQDGLDESAQANDGDGLPRTNSTT